MPTENRSSNTEMVSVPRELLQRIDSMYTDGMSIYGECEEIRAILVQPAEQHQGEPVAWLYKGTTTGDMLSLTRKEDHFECKYSDYGEHVKGEPLYTHPAPADHGEVERLKSELVESDHAFVRIAREAEQLRAQLADLKRRHDGLHRDMATIAGREVPKGCTVADYAAAAIADALPTNAEPEATQVEPEKPGRCTSCDNCQGFNTGHDSSQQKPYSIRCDNCHKEARASDHAGLARAWNAINQGE